MKKFILLTLLLILTRFADAETTYLYTADLSKEANPLVSLLGAGWTGMIIAECAGLLFVIYALSVYCFRSVQLPDVRRATSLKEFISLFYFGDPKSFSKLFYRLPTNRNALLYSFGYILTYSLIVIGIVVSASTTLLLLSEPYRTAYTTYRIPVWLYGFCALVTLLYSYRFYQREWRLRSS